MNRKRFLKLFGLGVGAVMIAPALIAKENVGSYTASCDSATSKVAVFNNGFWIHKEEWDAQKHWYDTQEQIMLKQIFDYE